MDSRYILFLALTRPALNKWGIPFKAFSYMTGGSVLFGIWAGRGTSYFQLLFFVVPFGLSYLACRALTAWDHNFTRVAHIWFVTKAKGLGLPGGSTLEPAPDGLPDDYRGIAGAV